MQNKTTTRKTVCYPCAKKNPALGRRILSVPFFLSEPAQRALPCCSFPDLNSLSWTSNPGPLYSLFHPPVSYSGSVCLLPFKHATPQAIPSSFQILLFQSPHSPFTRRYKHSQRSKEQWPSQKFWKQFHSLTSGTMADAPLLNVRFLL